ncbi:MAG: hypothetical protein RLY58_1626 [Pseudomonadota bacterium]|jgi:hypothetical protein
MKRDHDVASSCKYCVAMVIDPVMNSRHIVYKQMMWQLGVSGATKR